MCVNYLLNSFHFYDFRVFFYPKILQNSIPVFHNLLSLQKICKVIELLNLLTFRRKLVLFFLFFQLFSFATD